MVLERTMGSAVGSVLQAVRIVVFEKIVVLAALTIMLVGIIVLEDAVLFGVGSAVPNGT